MKLLQVLLGCTLLFLSGCMEFSGEEKAHMNSANQQYAGAQELCMQQQTACSYAYSPAWHDVFK